jgi:DNA polymerase-3 subunit epsilon
MREIILDTETTGLNPRGGDRVIEIGCVELVNRYPTGREYHVYINPERDVPAEAQAVHGISSEFLHDKPKFAALADEFLTFVGDATLIIHNASFDIGFLNFELERLGKTAIGMERVVDTLALARRKHPSGPNSLDALCKRYGIDNGMRVKHGALLDSVLLAEVYLELLGERQGALTLATANSDTLAASLSAGRARQAQQRPAPLPSRLTAEDEAAHATFVATLGPSAIWLQYQEAGAA